MDLARTYARLIPGNGLEAAGAAAAVVLVLSGMALGAWSMRNFGEPPVAAAPLNTVISEAPLLRSCDLPVLSRPIGDRQPNGRPMMLKIDAMLEFEGAAPCDEVLRKQPQVLQRLDGLFGGLRIGDLQGSRGSYQLRADMLQLVNEVLAPIRVKDVLFKEMLVH